MYKYFKSVLLMAFALFVVCCSTSMAQTITGSVNGTVTDPTGAVVPNAKVTATNVDTGIATATTTNGDGIYNLRFLQIGNYKIPITSHGFPAPPYAPFVLEPAQ